MRATLCEFFTRNFKLALRCAARQPSAEWKLSIAPLPPDLRPGLWIYRPFGTRLWRLRKYCHARTLDSKAQRYSGVVTQDNNHVGLCADCKNMRLIKSDRASVFYFCQLSASDARFPKYPRLPVLECAGYEKISTAEAQRRGEGQSGS